MQDPALRIRVIGMSLRCFVYGCLSLLPFVGLLMSAIALGLHFRTMRAAGGEWNPARRYLIVGYSLAWLGILITACISGGIAAALIGHHS